MIDTPKLEAVYYSWPIPQSLQSLTFMGLVFDRLHFPHVQLPVTGYDPSALQAEILRLESVSKSHDTQKIISLLRFLPYVGELKDFCVFDESETSVFGHNDPRASPLVDALEEEIFGPRAVGNFPINRTATTKQIPGSDACVSFPEDLFYPVRALLYSADNGIPLINDDPRIPVLGISPKDAKVKNRAGVLSAIIAMECIGMLLPKLRPLQPGEIREFRAENAALIAPFRRALLQLAAKLNASISSTSTNDEVMEAARFFVETTVHPELIDLKHVLDNPSKKWYGRAWDATKQTPEIATTYFTVGQEAALAKLLAAVGGVFVDIQREDIEKEALLRKSGLHYLLKVSKLKGA